MILAQGRRGAEKEGMEGEKSQKPDELGQPYPSLSTILSASLRLCAITLCFSLCYDFWSSGISATTRVYAAFGSAAAVIGRPMTSQSEPAFTASAGVMTRF